jgi:hypothetical protein
LLDVRPELRDAEKETSGSVKGDGLRDQAKRFCSLFNLARFLILDDDLAHSQRSRWRGFCGVLNSAEKVESAMRSCDPGALGAIGMPIDEDVAHGIVWVT